MVVGLATVAKEPSHTEGGRERSRLGRVTSVSFSQLKGYHEERGTGVLPGEALKPPGWIHHRRQQKVKSSRARDSNPNFTLS